jgi:uncharacterized protein
MEQAMVTPIPILTIPGLNNSGPTHWQSRWEASLPHCHRVELGHWDAPDRDLWVEALDNAIARIDTPAYLAAHSLGCHVVAHWAAEASPAQLRRVAGALLVAPPQVEQPALDPRLTVFAPVGALRTGFPLTLVTSSNDPYCTLGQARTMARRWRARLIDAGAFGHINADSGLGDWPYGKYLLRRLVLSSEQRVRAVHQSGMPDLMPPNFTVPSHRQTGVDNI